MKIKLSPVRADMPPLQAIVESEDLIIINGEPFDFSPLKAGETLPRAALGETSPFVSDIERGFSGELLFTLRLPHGMSAPQETRFPSAYDIPINISSGELPVPPYNAGEEDI